MCVWVYICESDPYECCIIRGSIVVSIPACHAGDPGSIPGSGVSFFYYFFFGAGVFSCMVLRCQGASINWEPLFSPLKKKESSKQKNCVARELNPDLLLGRQQC